MRDVVIDRTLFDMAFKIDVDYQEPYPVDKFLNLNSGDTRWLYENDEDTMYNGLDSKANAALRADIESNPDKYLEIPGLTHGEHHEIIQKFVCSDWTADEEMRSHAEQTYYERKSIGYWMKNAGDQAISEYYKFKENNINMMTVKFLNDNGINPIWR